MIQIKVSENQFTFIFILVFVTPALAVATFAFFMIPEIRYRNSPEQSAQVEVVEKRVYIYSSSGRGRPYTTSHTFIVAFKFSDDSIKELEIDCISVERDPNKSPYSSLYSSINEGDTGMLTYKEIDNIEEKYKNEDMRFDGRLFINFEKDPEPND